MSAVLAQFSNTCLHSLRGLHKGSFLSDSTPTFGECLRVRPWEISDHDETITAHGHHRQTELLTHKRSFEFPRRCCFHDLLWAGRLRSNRTKDKAYDNRHSGIRENQSRSKLCCACREHCFLRSRRLNRYELILAACASLALIVSTVNWAYRSTMRVTFK